MTIRILRRGSGVLLLAFTGTVFGAGFQIQEQSVKGLGNAFAGGAAIAEDASTVLSNPAGMARLTERQIMTGLHVIIPQSKFKDKNSTNGIGGLPTGDASADGGKPAAVPNAFFVLPLSDRLHFGVATTSLFGLATEYDDNWIGRYHAIESELLTLMVNPALSYRVNNQVSLGFGVSAQYAKATLTNALDFGTLGFLAGVPGALPSNPAFDGLTEVKGDDWGFGFNLGVLFEPKPGTRIGLAYRSKIAHTLEGDNTLTIPDFAVALAGPSRTRDVTADFTSPAIFSISGYHELNSRWAVMADITWTDWSEFDELRIQFGDGSADSVQPEEWEDSFHYAVGVNYKYSPAWTLRAGIQYDETPVPSAELRTPRVPDNSRTWLALGASYQLSPQFSFDVGYAHLFISDTRINDTEVTTGGLAGAPVGSTLDGEYEASVDIISAQLQWHF